jgi:hypothetical protein
MKGKMRKWSSELRKRIGRKEKELGFKNEVYIKKAAQ